MATRRAPARARNGNSLLPTSSSAATRPRSALAKARPEIESVSEDAEDCHHSSITPQASSSKLSQVADGGDSHIQVVIRCRRRSEREIQEASPIILSSDGPRGQHITIETAATTSVLGLVTLPPTRTYPFDVVFGPEADQSMVYQDVVHPMLEEVLKGYNCTLFAYGQTGTGKTYTMQGDLALSPLGNPSAQAGMIPRVLFKLFHQLEANATDYSVKISYVELYNEELRDLLASELSVPSGSVQPMGMGVPKDGPGGLKIYDDSSKKGVLIQGLEEVPVKDFNDALVLLAKGSQRRQIAATKFNDHSSRSHSVFSITVHTKETSSLGDDLLKVGKLNLVDLAGSENIGRSGAENKRAREAGMINQSLLTLGRVINALVDKSSHVPYRESKLTRLLQDSLGGRTKTCIIATVSPARSNMEETLSTLDYAMRAKSIRNKPEVNQRMSRNALLKEYIAEIERLKSDVLAAREKNGIYFSEETWAQLSTEHELRQTEVEEAKKQVEMIESQMRSVREEFEQSIALLMKTDGELKDTKQRLHTREGELQQKEEELVVVKVALEEEEVIRKAHATTEVALDGVAHNLKQVVEESTQDVSGLFGKIERKSAEYNANVKAAKSRSKLLDEELQSFGTAVDKFMTLADQNAVRSQTLATAFVKAESTALSAHQQFIGEQVKRMHDLFKTVSESEDASDRNLQSIWGIVREVQDCLSNELSSWSARLESDIMSTCLKIEEANTSNFSAIEKATRSLGSAFEKLVKDARATVENERKQAGRQNELVSLAARQEIARLKKQNAYLAEVLESERKENMKARDALVKRVSSMLLDFAEERDKGLRNVYSHVQDENTAALANMQTLSEKHADLLNESTASTRSLNATVEKAVNESNRAKLSADKGMQSVRSTLQDGLIELRDSTMEAMKEHSSDIIRVSDSLNTCSQVFEREHKIKRARIEATSELKSNAQSVLDNCEGTSAVIGESRSMFEKEFDAEASALSSQIRSLASSSSVHTSAVQEYAHLLLEESTRQSNPTGSTPQKRKWHYVDNWERTRDRSELIQEYHRHKETSMPTDSTASPSSSDEIIYEPIELQEERRSSLANSDARSEEHPEPLRDSHASSNATLSDENAQRESISKLPLSLNGDNALLLKAQPPRVTLQEKSVNILPEPRTRITRSTRRR